MQVVSIMAIGTSKTLLNILRQYSIINLGDFYYTFLEIEDRKGSRTLFIDKLIKLLEEKLDGLDCSLSNHTEV